MKKPWIGMFFAMTLSAICPAQDAAPPPTEVPQAPQNPTTTQSAQTGGPTRIAPGSVLPVQLSKSLDAKKAKNGDPVEAKVAEDLKTPKGDVLVPKDTKVVGHITEAQARSKEQNESQLGIAFDHIVLKGTDVAMPMSIQAIIGQSALNGGSNSGNQGGASYPAPGGGGMPSGSTSGRPPGMGTGTAPQPQTSPGETPGNQRGTSPHPPITGDTQGVVGISNLKLSTSGNTQTGSVVSSEKGNVKLDGGTLMLLRVN